MPARRALSPRKKPVQRRAQDTVDAILEAAARVLAERGYAAATTNRIAERAGVSIGSLYEYFPGKDAILAQLLERHVEEGARDVLAWLAEAARAPLPVRALIDGLLARMLELHERRPTLHRVLFEEAPHPHQTSACVLRVEDALAHGFEAALRAAPGRRSGAGDVEAHLAVQTAEALCHRFVLHGIHELGRAAFLRGSADLLEGYLGTPRVARRGGAR